MKAAKVQPLDKETQRRIRGEGEYAPARIFERNPIDALTLAHQKLADQTAQFMRSMTRVGLMMQGMQQARSQFATIKESPIYSSVGTGLSNASPSPKYEGKGIGRITDYGQKDDPYMDSLTNAGKSAIGNITPDYSMAFSRDVEAYAKSKGIKIGDDVTVVLGDGTRLKRRFDDRTRADLTGRIDLHMSAGKSPYREFTVVDIEPYTP